MKKLLLLSMLALVGASINAATIKFDNKTGYPLNAKIFLVGGSSVPVNIPTGISDKSFSGCWVGINFNSFQDDTGNTIRGMRLLSQKTMGIQMTCQPKTLEATRSNINQLNVVQK